MCKDKKIENFSIYISNKTKMLLSLLYFLYLEAPSDIVRKRKKFKVSKVGNKSDIICRRDNHIYR